MSGSRGKASKEKYNLQKLINHVRDNTESWEVIRTWNLTSGDDRSQAIVVSALLEQALEFALGTHFIVGEKDTRAIFTDQEGGISSFAAKIRLAFGLGVIENKIRGELVRIKNIRNTFAHTRAAVTFDTDEIKASCEQLFLPATIQYGGLLGLTPISAKNKFASSVKMIYLYLSSKEKKDQSPVSYKKSDFYHLVLLGVHREKDLAEMVMEVAAASRTT
jgi:hypothetical protein